MKRNLIPWTSVLLLAACEGTSDNPPPEDVPDLVGGDVPVVLERDMGRMASDGKAGDAFGAPMAMDGRLLVVGAPRFAVGGIFEAGHAYVYRPTADGWVEEQALVSLDESDFANFGSHVDVSDDTIMVGVHDSVQIYERAVAGWQVVSDIPVHASGGVTSMAMSGDLAAIGVRAQSGEICRSEIRIFQRGSDGWRPIETLKGETCAFGEHLAMQREEIVATDRDSVRILRRSIDAWTETEEIVMGEFAEPTTIALDADTMVIAASKAGAPEDSGRAWIYERQPMGWTLAASLAPRSPVLHGHFGESVAVWGDMVAIGAPGSTLGENGVDHGNVQLWQRVDNGWQDYAMVRQFQPESHLFGESVALDGNWLVVGEPGWAGGRGILRFYDLETLPR